MANDFKIEYEFKAKLKYSHVVSVSSPSSSHTRALIWLENNKRYLEEIKPWLNYTIGKWGEEWIRTSTWLSFNDQSDSLTAPRGYPVQTAQYHVYFRFKTVGQASWFILKYGDGLL